MQSSRGAAGAAIRGAAARFIDAVIERPVLALIATAAVLGGLAAGLVRPGLTMEVKNVFFVDGDPALEAYDRLPRLFGDDRYIFLTVTAPPGAPSVFNPDTFRVVEAITAFLEAQPLVIQVRGITKYQRIIPADDVVRAHDIWPLAPPYDTFQALERDLMRDELVIGSLVTPDGRTTMIGALIERLPQEDNARYGELTGELEQFLAALDARGHVTRIAGETVFGSWLQRISSADFNRMAPVMLLAIFLPLFAIFRRWVAVALPAAVIIGSVVATMGLLALIGMRLNIINFLLPVILLPLGIADCAHLLADFFRFYRRDQRNAKDAVRHAMAEVLWPVVFTSVTTAGGFVGLVTSRLRPIRELGLEAGFGIALLLAVTLVVLPACLSRYRGRDWRPHVSDRGAMAWIADAVPRWCHRWRWPIVIVSCAVLPAVCVPLLGRLRAESDYKSLFKQSSAEHRALVDVDHLLGGTIPLELIIDSGRADGIKDPAFLRAVGELGDWLAASRRGAPPRTLVDYLEATNEALQLYRDPRHPERGYHTLPPGADQIAQLLVVYQSMAPRDAVAGMMDSTGQFLRVSFPLPIERSGKFQDTIDAITAWLAAYHPELAVTMTGNAAITLVLDRYIIDTTHSSFATGLAIVLVCILLVLRSLRLWLLSILPNVVPLLVVGAALAVLDIPLDAGTTMVASITCGLLVDDTIHFMSRLGFHIQRGAGPIEAVSACYREVGTALILTSVVLAMGFSVYLMGSFVPNIRFGLLACLVIALGLIADLVMVPALLFVAWPRKEARCDTLPLS